MVCLSSAFFVFFLLSYLENIIASNALRESLHGRATQPAPHHQEVNVQGPGHQIVDVENYPVPPPSQAHTPRITTQAPYTSSSQALRETLNLGDLASEHRRNTMQNRIKSPLRHARETPQIGFSPLTTRSIQVQQMGGSEMMRGNNARLVTVISEVCTI